MESITITKHPFDEGEKKGKYECSNYLGINRITHIILHSNTLYRTLNNL